MSILYLILISVFILPIVFISLSIKYIKDVRESVDCSEINSSYLTFYYYYYWIDLVFLILLLLLSTSIIMTMSTKALSKKMGRKTSHNYIHTLISSLLLGFFIKLLIDIGNEEECKEVDPKLRTFLLTLNSFSLISLILNLFTM